MKFESDPLSNQVNCKKKVKLFNKPAASYITLIQEAIKKSPKDGLTLSEIYESLRKDYECFRLDTYDGWKNSIRHNLSLNDCFIKVPKVKGKTGKGHYWQLDPHAKNQFNDSTVRRRPRGYRAIIQASRPLTTCPPPQDRPTERSDLPATVGYPSIGYPSAGSSTSPTNYQTGYFDQASFYPSTGRSATQAISSDQQSSDQQLGSQQFSNRLHNHQLSDQQLSDQQLDYQANLSPPLDQSNQVSSSFDSGPDQQTVASRRNFYSPAPSQITRKQFELNSILLQQDQLNHQLNHQMTNQLHNQLNHQLNYSTSTARSPCFTPTTPVVYPNLLPSLSVPVDANYSHPKTDYPATEGINQLVSTGLRPNQTDSKANYTAYAEIAYPDNKLIYLSSPNADKAYSFHGFRASREEEIHSINCDPTSECKRCS